MIFGQILKKRRPLAIGNVSLIQLFLLSTLLELFFSPKDIYCLPMFCLSKSTENQNFVKCNIKAGTWEYCLPKGTLYLLKTKTKPKNPKLMDSSIHGGILGFGQKQVEGFHGVSEMTLNTSGVNK